MVCKARVAADRKFLILGQTCCLYARARACVCVCVCVLFDEDSSDPFHITSLLWVLDPNSSVQVLFVPVHWTLVFDYMYIFAYYNIHYTIHIHVCTWLRPSLSVTGPCPSRQIKYSKFKRSYDVRLPHASDKHFNYAWI
jgi:hypothetical protein